MDIHRIHREGVIFQGKLYTKPLRIALNRNIIILTHTGMPFKTGMEKDSISQLQLKRNLLIRVTSFQNKYSYNVSNMNPRYKFMDHKQILDI